MGEQKKELKFKCYRDVNNCWCATIKVTDGVHTKPYSVAAAPEMKNRAAKSYIKETFEEYLGEHSELQVVSED